MRTRARTPFNSFRDVMGYKTNTLQVGLPPSFAEIHTKKETRGFFFVVTQGEGQRENAPEGRLSRPVQSKCAQRETRALRRHTQRERGGGSQVLASALELVFTAESNDDGEARRETDADDVTLTRRATN
jgi:hypothetical protein